jgi:hypothetical protein
MLSGSIQAEDFIFLLKAAANFLEQNKELSLGKRGFKSSLYSFVQKVLNLSLLLLNLILRQRCDIILFENQLLSSMRKIL